MSLATCDSETEEASATGASVRSAWIASVAANVCTAALGPMRDEATLRLERAEYRTMATPTPVAKKIVSICSNTTICLHPSHQLGVMTSNGRSNHFNKCIKKEHIGSAGRGEEEAELHALLEEEELLTNPGQPLVS